MPEYKPYSLIDYWNKGKIETGLLLCMEKSKLNFISTRGEILKMSPEKAIYITPPPAGFPAHQTPNQFLAENLILREKLQAEIKLEELWEIFSDNPQTGLNLEELADFYFATDDYSPLKFSALFILLMKDRVYFTRKQELFFPRTPDMVEKLLRDGQLKIQRELAEGVLSGQLKAFREGNLEHLELEPELIEELKRLAIGEGKGDSRLANILKQAGFNSASAPFYLLVKIGVWQEDENLELYKHDIPVIFSSKVLNEAQNVAQICTGDEIKKNREDLTGLYALTIDAPETREVDDGFSWEELSDGFMLWIHLANPSVFIPKDSLIEKEAQRRTGSLYLPEQRIPMLPPLLGEEVFSLKENQVRPALSVRVEMNRDFQLLDYRFIPSLIKIKKRLSYQEVDAILKDESAEEFFGLLKGLYRAALKLQAERIANGGVNLNLPRVEVWLDQEQNIIIEKDESDTPAQILVSELNILANRLAGEFFCHNAIPAFYRIQERPEGEIPQMLDFHPLVWQEILSLLPRTYWGMEASGHFSLGFPVYTQISSPLRRYPDYLMQRQLVSWLQTQNSEYDEESLTVIFSQIKEAMEITANLERSSRDYWLHKYLEKQKGREISGFLLKILPSQKGVILLDELMLKTLVRLPAGKNYPLGERLNFKLQGVNPRKSEILLSF